MKIHVPSNVQVISTAKAMFGSVSDGGASSDTRPVKADSDMSDDDDSSDNDDDSTPRPAAKAQPTPQPQPHPEGHQYTLRVTGSATVGSLEILHDAAPSH
jgi:hypothetical protein